jgi:predicted PP-loop superfamily ATPase
MVLVYLPKLVVQVISFISLLKKKKVERSKEIKSSPAKFSLKISNMLPKKHAQSLLQEISDMRLEYYEALSEKKIWRAKCIVAFYYVGLSWSVVMWISDKFKEVIGIIPKKN